MRRRCAQLRQRCGARVCCLVRYAKAYIRNAINRATRVLGPSDPPHGSAARQPASQPVPSVVCVCVRELRANIMHATATTKPGGCSNACKNGRQCVCVCARACVCGQSVYMCVAVHCETHTHTYARSPDTLGAAAMMSSRCRQSVRTLASLARAFININSHVIRQPRLPQSARTVKSRNVLMQIGGASHNLVVWRPHAPLFIRGLLLE